MNRRDFLKILSAIPAAAGLPMALSPGVIAETLPEVDPPFSGHVNPHQLRINDVLINFNDLSLEGIIDKSFGVGNNGAMRMASFDVFRERLTVTSTDPECEKLRDVFNSLTKVQVQFIAFDIKQQFEAQGYITAVDITIPPANSMRYKFEMELFDLFVMQPV